MTSFKVSRVTKSLLEAALLEDIGKGDVTSNLLISMSVRGGAAVLAKEAGVFCGAPVIRELLKLTDSSLKVRFLVREGDTFNNKKKLFFIKGRVLSILKVERTLLNLLGHLSGIATRTAEYVKKVTRYRVSILDTRKTTPLWRELEKYAVLVGGGKNHRMGLYDAIFVKENHRIYGNLQKLRQVRGRFEIEVRNLKELQEALMISPRVILLDNFKPAHLKQAVKMARRFNPKIILEASGGMTLKNVTSYAASGVDWISIGALTHSVKSIDLSLLIQ